MRRDTRGLPSPPETSEPRDDKQTPSSRRKCGRPKGSRNRNKTDVQLSDTLKHVQTMIKALLRRIDGKYLENPAWHSPKITDFLLVDLIDAERLLLESRFHFELFSPRVADQIHRLNGFHYDQKTKQRHISNPIPFSPKFKESKKRYIRRGAIVLGISFVLMMVLHNNLTSQHDMAFQFNSGWLFSDEVEGPSLRELIYVLASMGVFGTCALVIWSFLNCTYL